MPYRFLSALSLALVALMSIAAAADDLATHSAATATQALAQPAKIAAYQARFGRSRPIIAVVGQNSGMVLSDYVVPYGVLARSGVAEVFGVSTQAGLQKLPPLQIQPDRTLADFDRQFPDGADYVFIPAVDGMEKHTDPALIAWLKTQADKGTTLISICNGALVLAEAGLLKGHRATAHFSTYEMRLKQYPDTQWVKNARYVVDGKIISSAGISAAMPTSLALVEAIGGTARAAALAKQLGVTDWGPAHNSDAFHIGTGDYMAGIGNTLFHGTQTIGIPVANGVDEISVAFTANAYSDTLRSEAHALAQSSTPIKTKAGMTLVPDRVVGQGKPLDSVLPESGDTPPMQVLDQVLDDITQRYGASTARFVILDMEYPGNKS